MKQELLELVERTVTETLEKYREKGEIRYSHFRTYICEMNEMLDVITEEEYLETVNEMYKGFEGIDDVYDALDEYVGYFIVPDDGMSDKEEYEDAVAMCKKHAGEKVFDKYLAVLEEVGYYGDGIHG